jgi:hypothetical protein
MVVFNPFREVESFSKILANHTETYLFLKAGIPYDIELKPMNFPEAIIKQLNPPSSYKHIVHEDMLHAAPRKHDGQYFTLLGSYHNTDADYWYYDAAFYFFDDWQNSTAGKKRVIIAEGEQDLWGVAPTLQKSVEEHYSEIGWQCFLADSYDIPIISGEPSNYGEIAQLVYEGQYSPQELLLYYGIREIPVWHRMTGNKEDFDTYMERVFAIYQRKLGKLALTHRFGNVSFSYAHFKEGYKQHFDAEPDPSSPEMNELYLSYTSAYMAEAEFAQQPIARVAKRVMQLRDAHLGAVYDDHLQNGESVFSWYGVFHTFRLAGYLRHFGKPWHAPREVITERSTWQESFIVQGLRRLPMGPDKIQTAVYNLLNWKSNRSMPPEWPEWLLSLDNPEPTAYQASHIKNHFQSRSEFPPSSDGYIRYVAGSHKGWGAAFVAYNQLERVSDELEPIIQNELANSWVNSEIFEKSSVDPIIIDDFRRLIWALRVTEEGYPEVAARLTDLRVHIAAAGSVNGYSQEVAALTFTTISKHLTGLCHTLYNVYDVFLSPTEQLYYMLDTLDHMLRNKGTTLPHSPIELAYYNAQ